MFKCIFFIDYFFNKSASDLLGPVVLFHGDQDRVIYHGSSLKLKAELKPQDTLITLKGQGHNGMTDNEAYKAALAKILQAD